MESNFFKKTPLKTPSKPPQNPQSKPNKKKVISSQNPKIFSNPDSLEDFESIPLELATKKFIFLFFVEFFSTSIIFPAVRGRDVIIFIFK
jgi:hypothetical protein